MRVIELNEEQVRIVDEATEPVTVRSPAGEIVGFIDPRELTFSPPTASAEGHAPR